jgi:hypothetical protein
LIVLEHLPSGIARDVVATEAVGQHRPGVGGGDAGCTDRGRILQGGLDHL